MIGHTLGHYRIVEKIGAGGMGVVYRAHDERLDRNVALKVLPSGLLSDEGARKRFRKEALALAKLAHPNIATIYDFDTQNGVDFLVTEYIPGVTLNERVSAGPLQDKEILRLGMQLAEGLAAAHAQNIVHRDLKPANLRITPDGWLKILDFGLAKLVQPVSDLNVTASLSETRAVAGTLPYMAPEQLQGAPVDPRTDIYATGVVLYEMATGHRPFREELAPRLTDAILHHAPEPPSAHNRAVAPALDSLIMKALEKEPERRHQTARDLLADFLRLSAPSSAVLLARPRRRYARWLVALSVALFLLLGALFGLNVGNLSDRVFGRPGTPQIRSLAVLPLENLSGDPNQEYFADGMTEELVTELGKVGGLRVISHTSVSRFKGAKMPLQEIARELQVDAVLEGAVVREGGRVRVTANLIRAFPEKNLWAESYDRDLRNILDLQSEIARTIADRIKITVTPEERQRLTTSQTVNAEAHELYLKGTFYNNKFTEEGFQRAIEYFEQSLAKDPRNARAYAGLADAYAGLGMGDIDAYPKEKAASLKALEIDDTLADAHNTLAWVKFTYDWDVVGAEREFRRAIELNASDAKTHAWYGMFLAMRGRIEESLQQVKKTRELDPLTLRYTFLAFRTYYNARDYNKAIEVCRNTLDMDPNFRMARGKLVDLYEQTGEFDKAIEEIQRLESSREANSKESEPSSSLLRKAYAAKGARGYWLQVLELVKAEAGSGDLNFIGQAGVYTRLGNKDEAFRQLDIAFKHRLPYLIWDLPANPAFDGLRSDPRYADLLQRLVPRVGLPP